MPAFQEILANCGLIYEEVGRCITLPCDAKSVTPPKDGGSIFEPLVSSFDCGLLLYGREEKSGGWEMESDQTAEKRGVEGDT